MLKCKNIMKQFTLHPGAVARQLLVNLKAYKPLTASEEGRLIAAIENAGVENGVDRMLASLSRNTLNKILKSI